MGGINQARRVLGASITSGLLSSRINLHAMRRLNGWVRLGLVLSAVWILVVSVVAGYELVNPKFGGSKSVFAYTDIPVGTKWNCEGDPWDHNWENDPSVKKVTVIRSQKLLAYLFIPVSGVWLLAVGFIFAVRWVRAGFNHPEG
jgi:hypothetical protein